MRKLDTGIYKLPHLQLSLHYLTVKSDFQQYSTVLLIKQLNFFNHLHSIHHFMLVNCGPLLAYITVRFAAALGSSRIPADKKSTISFSLTTAATTSHYCVLLSCFSGRGT